MELKIVEPRSHTRKIFSQEFPMTTGQRVALMGAITLSLMCAFFFIGRWFRRTGARAKLDLGRVLIQKKEYSRAQKILDQGISQWDSIPELYYLRALCFAEAGHHNLANQDLDRAIDLDEHRYDYYFQRGRILAVLGHIRRAEADFLSSISLKKSHWQSYYEMAFLYYKRGDYRRAENTLNMALSSGGESAAPVYELLGYLQCANGFENKGRELLNRATKLDSSYGLDNFRVAHAALGESRWADAERHFLRFLKLTPPTPPRGILHARHLMISFQEKQKVARQKIKLLRRLSVRQPRPGVSQ